jgi:hypothetical protein
MNLISNVAGAIDTGGGGRSGSVCGGSAVAWPGGEIPTGALTKRSKSSAGHVVNWPATRVIKASTAGQRRSGRRRLLTIGARCCVMSPDCIQNVDNLQLQARAMRRSEARGEFAPTARMRSSAAVGSYLSTAGSDARCVIRIGRSAWRVGPRPQPTASRRTTAATSASGSPTGHAADAASRSDSSPSKSEDASPNRA